MAILIGTAGHVDHGKTSLIKALTGIDADRLPEEKERGMTLDLGFASIEIPGIGPVSIVDVPGHEKFLKNMLVGALGTDLCILCIAADDSVMPQTREHLQILDLLQTKKLIVALTRCDLVEQDLIDLCKLDIEDLLSTTSFAGSPIIETSAKSGKGIEELKLTLGKLFSEANLPSENSPWYLPIDRVFGVKGKGTVVTGTLMRGEIHAGETAILQPGNLKVRIREMQSHYQVLEKAESRSRVALNIAQQENVDLARGMMLGKDGSVHETDCFNLEIRSLVPPRHGERIRISIGSEEAIGKIFLFDNSPNQVQIRTEVTVACTLGQPAILRRYSPMELLGGGTVTDPLAPKLRKNSIMEPTSSPSFHLTLNEQIMNCIASKPNGCTTEYICRQTERTPQELGTPLENLKQKHLIFGFAGIWLNKETLANIEKRIFDALARLHEANPQVPGHAKDTILKEAGLAWDAKPLARLLTLWTEENKLVLMHAGHSLKGFTPKLNNRQNELLDKLIESLDSNLVEVESPANLAKTLVIPKQAVDEILKVGQSAGRIVMIFEDMYYSKESLIKIVMQLKDLPPTFTAAEFRDHFKTSRKYAIPLLEYFDSKQITVRNGETRRLRI